MDKLKNIFNPGHKQDEEILYGSGSTHHSESSTAGALSGQGSHFQHQKAAETTTQQNPDLEKDSLNKDGASEETRNANTAPVEATSAVSGAGTAHASAPTKGATNAERHTGKLSTPAQPATDGISAASVRSGVIGEVPQAKTLPDSEIPVGDAGTGALVAAGSAAVLDSTKDAPSASQEPAAPMESLDSETQQAPIANAPSAGTWRPDAPTPGPEIPGAFPITPQPYSQDRQLGGEIATIDSVSKTGNSAGDALYEAHRNGSVSAGAPPIPVKQSGSAQADPEHHYARDAAAVGAVGAGVAVAANATHEDSGPASKTVGKHKSNLANILDPTVLPQPDKQKGHKETVSAETGTGPASKTVGRHNSNVANIIDPTVLPQPEMQTKHATSGPHKSDMFNRLDPQVSSQEPKEEQAGHGKDAAVAAGVGAAATGAYAAEKAHHESPQTSPTVDTTHSPTTQPPIIPTTSGRGWHGGPTGTAVSSAGNSPKHNYSSPKSTELEDGSHTAQPHFDPGTAMAGGGALAGAAAVYEVEKHHNEKAERGSREVSSGHPDSLPTRAASTAPQTASSPDKQHHSRDAAIGGAGIAGAGALASKHEPNKSDSSIPSATSPKSDKERTKEEKKHEKELAKEAKKREKQLAKEQKKAEKEQEKIVAKEEKEKKHHHGLLSFLHRDKHQESEVQSDQVDGTHEEEEKAGNADVLSADIPIAGNPTPIRVSSLSGRNRLHKNPPKDFAAKAAYTEGPGNGQAVHDGLPPTEYPGQGEAPSGGYGYGHDYDYNHTYGYGYSNEEERERATRPVDGGNAASTIPDVAASNAHTAF